MAEQVELSGRTNSENCSIVVLVIATLVGVVWIVRPALTFLFVRGIARHGTQVGVNARLTQQARAITIGVALIKNMISMRTRCAQNVACAWMQRPLQRLLQYQ